MPEEDKIKNALKEIPYCPNLVVGVGGNGEIVVIRKGVYQKTQKHGVKAQYVIDEDITK